MTLGVPPNHCTAPKVSPVVWHPPLSGWVKVNTDGMSKGNPGISASAGVFRDSWNNFCGAFVMPLAIRNWFFAELHAILQAIIYAHDHGW